MTNDRETLFGGRHQKVLEHPDHTAGVNHGMLTIVSRRALAPTVERITGLLDHAGDLDRWRTTNPAVRLELADPDAGEVVSRVYTARSFAMGPDGPQVEIDIVRHGGESLMMRWLANLQVGDRVRILGPRPHFCPHLVPGVPVALFADETAIPAVATVIRDWPTGAEGHVWVETPDGEVVEDLPRRPGVTVHWLRREAEQLPGTTGALVAAALDFSERHPGEITVWACGEFGEMKQIRDHFRRERAMSKEEVVVFGYWRRQVSSTQIDVERLQRYERALALNPEMVVIDEFDDEV